MLGATTLRRMRTTMTKVLEGKVAVITGGNRGMGLATAKRFVAEGAHVVITGRRQEQIDIALKETGSRKAIGGQADVANMKDLDRLYATVKEKYGHIGVSEQQAQEFGASIVQSVPMGRTGTPEEIASAVLFLASNESSYLSGIELAVDGGMAQV